MQGRGGGRGNFSSLLWRQVGRFAFGEVGSAVLGRYGGYAASAVGAGVGQRFGAGEPGYSGLMYGAIGATAGIAAVRAGAALARYGDSRAVELAGYSGRLATAEANVQIARLRGDIQSAGMYGEGLGAIHESVGKLGITATQLLDSVANALAPVITFIADILKAILEAIKAIFDLFANQATGGAGQAVADLVYMVENIQLPGIHFVEGRRPERDFNAQPRKFGPTFFTPNNPLVALGHGVRRIWR